MPTIKSEMSRTVNFKFSHFVPDTTVFEHMSKEHKCANQQKALDGNWQRGAMMNIWFHLSL